MQEVVLELKGCLQLQLISQKQKIKVFLLELQEKHSRRSLQKHSRLFLIQISPDLGLTMSSLLLRKFKMTVEV
jgi:hypothetical protein